MMKEGFGCVKHGWSLLIREPDGRLRCVRCMWMYERRD